jgi:hypothetical protein
MKKAIVIIARNEGEWTRKTVDNLSVHFPDCEFIGVDDGGVNEWPDYVRVIKTTGGTGVGRCRLTGVQNTDADLILVADGHVYYDSGNIDKAWQLAAEGYIVNSTTKGIESGKRYGNGRIHALPSHKCKHITAKEGDEVGLIGGVYFMRRDVSLEVIAPTPSHGYNEQIMTCAALCLGHRIYCYPDFCFSHLYKKKFNYKQTYSSQERNKKLLDWWFFAGMQPSVVSLPEYRYHQFIQQNRGLTPDDLRITILEMNKKLLSYEWNKRV